MRHKRLTLRMRVRRHKRRHKRLTLRMRVRRRKRRHKRFQTGFKRFQAVSNGFKRFQTVSNGVQDEAWKRPEFQTVSNGFKLRAFSGLAQVRPEHALSLKQGIFRAGPGKA